MHWQPSASLETLHHRAQCLQKIRQFFIERHVLEVETPLLSHATVTAPHLSSIPAYFQPIGSDNQQKVFLQTSPEYAMKRLLAAGSGPIFQLTKAFRQGEIGKRHNPEFTMLEWYRPGWDHHQLMDEMDEFLQTVLTCLPAKRLSYSQAFQQFLNLDPHTISLEELISYINTHAIKAEWVNDRDTLLDILFTHCIEPHFSQNRPCFLYDFPISQAALAKICYEQQPPTASRFEVYFKGIELANGFHELQDSQEQRRRFENDLAYRKQHQLELLPIDERLLAALAHGLPDCAGVALGIDRLIMLALDCQTISHVLSFPFEDA